MDNPQNTPQTLPVVIDLSPDQAWALAQFLKRAGVSDYQRLAVDEAEAYAMFYAAETLRAALIEAGYTPR